jgi:hypothetical protein
MRNAWPLRGLLVAVLLTSCEGATHVTLTAESFSVYRYEPRAPLLIHELENPSSAKLSQVSIEASCTEEWYPNLETDFGPVVLSLAPGQLVGQVTVPFSGGWPYFTDGIVSCRFDVWNASWPSEPNALLEFR